MNVDIHRATVDEAKAFYDLRVRALRDHPEAFGESLTERLEKTVDDMRRYIEKQTENDVFLGAHVDELVGTIHIHRPARLKRRHRAHIGAMYVAPEARHQGIGRAILHAAVKHARSLGGIEQIVLAVTAGNDPARRLYEGAGFKAYARDPRYLKIGDTYHDLIWMSYFLTS